jgi:hypothetical protein
MRYSVEFTIVGEEFRLYRDVTAFVKTQSSQAAAHGEEDTRARAVELLMVLYQQRLASAIDLKDLRPRMVAS